MCNKKGNSVNLNSTFDASENGANTVTNIPVYILGEGKSGKSCQV